RLCIRYTFKSEGRPCDAFLQRVYAVKMENATNPRTIINSVGSFSSFAWLLCMFGLWRDTFQTLIF
ncbi:hypothetical protein BDN70DRAFT_889143, partial [Pholiota conissans]